MIFESKEIYIDLVENVDIYDIVGVYNSNKNFLLNHMNTDNIKYEWMLKELESMKKSNFYSYKVVKKDSNKIIGIIDFKIDYETYLSLLMIHSNYKNRGLGKLIYQAVEEYVKLLKSKYIRIDVVTNYDNSVLDFWIKRGFVKFKNIELNWAEKILPAIIMKKSL